MMPFLSYAPVVYLSAKTGYNVRRTVEAIDRATNGEAILATDVGQHQMWCAQYFRHTHSRHFLSSGGMGTMGYSLPAAIGAKLADPSREVIAVCGDGSFQMQMMELATAVQHNVNVKVIVMRNNYLGMVRELQERAYDNRLTAVSLDGSPCFTKLAGMQTEAATCYRAGWQSHDDGCCLC